MPGSSRCVATPPMPGGRPAAFQAVASHLAASRVRPASAVLSNGWGGIRIAQCKTCFSSSMADWLQASTAATGLAECHATARHALCLD